MDNNTEEFILCEGCGKQILEGMEIVNIDFEDGCGGYTIHKDMECIEKLDFVSTGTITKIKNVTDEYTHRPILKRIK